MLSEQQRRQFFGDGYLVLPGFKNAAEIFALRARAGEIVDAFDPRNPGRSFRRESKADIPTNISCTVATRSVASSRKRHLMQPAR